MTFHVPRKKRRRPSYRKKSGVFATPGGVDIGGGFTRASVMAAAELFAAKARANASNFSTRIPPATTAEPYGEQEAQIVTDGTAAPNAAPFEFGERHPLFGDRAHWYKQQTRAYMNRAARDPGTIGAAADIYGTAEAELLSKEYGYTE
jgi:hypothetical protein